MLNLSAATRIKKENLADGIVRKKQHIKLKSMKHFALEIIYGFPFVVTFTSGQYYG